MRNRDGGGVPGCRLQGGHLATQSVGAALFPAPGRRPMHGGERLGPRAAPRPLLWAVVAVAAVGLWLAAYSRPAAARPGASGGFFGFGWN